MEDKNSLSTQTDLRTFLSTLIESKKLPPHIKSVEEAFTIAQMGKELGFATMQAFHYIIPVQGKLTLSAKAIGGLLRRGGVKYITKEDAVYVYRDGSVCDIPKPGEDKPYDRRTTIAFFRDDMEEVCSYSWKDAEHQGLTVKDNWKRMPREMLFSRCLSKGANRIGPDLLLGLYTTEEMIDALNVNEAFLKRDDDGTITEIAEEVK